MFHRQALVGGLIGGAVGAAIWAAVVYVTGYEIGWIAWGVGGLVGFGVAVGNQGSEGPPAAAGVLAVAITVLAILAGKYAAVQLMMPSDAEIIEMFTAEFENEEFVVSFLADEVVEELELAGRTVEWPAGSDPDNAAYRSDYPADVWTEAAARWDAMSADEQAQFRVDKEADVRDNVTSNLPEIRAAFAEGGFLGSFAAMDILFFGLAMVTAFGVGSGGGKTEAEVAETYQHAVKLAMLRVMLADGEASDEEVQTVRDLFLQMTGTELSMEEVRAEAFLAESDEHHLPAALTELAPYLPDEGKETVIAAAVMVAAADGQFADSEQALITEIAQSIGMSESHLRGTIAQMLESE